MTDDDDAKEWFRSAAWAGFILWATEQRGFQDAYLKASGEAVSADSMERFVMWLTKEHWGASEAPQRIPERKKPARAAPDRLQLSRMA